MKCAFACTCACLEKVPAYKMDWAGHVMPSPLRVPGLHTALHAQRQLQFHSPVQLDNGYLVP